MQKIIKHCFGVSASRFWTDVYFNPDYTRGLFLDGMACEAYRLVSEEGVPGERYTRTIHSTPKLNAPGAVKKVLGESMSYTERGSFDPQSGKYSFEVVPSTMANKIKIRGTYWVESVADNEVERTCVLDFTVKIFGLGRVVEQFIAQQYADNQELAAAYTTRWIGEHLS